MAEVDELSLPVDVRERMDERALPRTEQRGDEKEAGEAEQHYLAGAASLIR